MKIAMLVLIVSDLAATKRFYCDLLGFALQGEDSGKLVFAHEGAPFVAFLGARPAPLREHGAEAASVFAFEVSALVEELARLRAAGVDIIHQTPGENEWGRYAALRDPSGNIIELMERTH
jgi:glyoxylase I family protein